MGKPTEINFTLVSGDSLTLRVKLVDRRGRPFDASAITQMRWHVARTVRTPEADRVIRKDQGLMSIVQDGDDWFLLVPIFPADSEDIKPGDYYHECELRDDAGTVLTPFTGICTIQEDMLT